MSTAKPKPLAEQYTPIRHRFLAAVAADRFALQFLWGGRSNLVLTDHGRKSSGRWGPDRGENIAYKWANENNLLTYPGGFQRDHPYSLTKTAQTLLTEWNTRHGDPLATEPKENDQ
ncbi:MAG: hypothetical protein HOY78_02570 [Saccharothrix sp.]|jgi:hypothetical protein|nr:hypothetical protein [Saccharothrix sp.]